MGDTRLVRLSRALGRLSSVVTYMNTGAHPDDEHSALLAALRYRFGIRVVILCSTRGEGGQNAIGQERGAALGVVRTREMEEAARALDASVAWVGHGPHDAVFDFGFSKDGDDTLTRWGGDVIVERVVKAYRRFRPDIVAPTFLDVPGQHGHHRAMTRAAMAAFDLAADPNAYPEQLASGLQPWQVGKLYLPAWSGAGSSYDDEEPPPEATVSVRAPGRDPVTGATCAQLGEWSRFFHATQGMGRWRVQGPEEWPLHLARSASRRNAEDSILDGLPATMGALASEPGVPPGMAEALTAAQSGIDEAIAAFPDPEAIIAAALRAAAAVDAARGACPARLQARIDHRLERKAQELDAVAFEAAGLSVGSSIHPPRIAPGGRGEVRLSAVADDPATEISVALRGRDGISIGASRREDTGEAFPVAIGAGTGSTNPYPPAFDPLTANGDLAIVVSATIGGRVVERMIDPDEALRVLPRASVSFDPDAVIVNLARPPSPIEIASEVDGDDTAPLELSPPSGWEARRTGAGFALATPADLAPGRFTIGVRRGSGPASRVRSASYPHIGIVEWAEPVALPALAVTAALPENACVAYVGGGSDRVDVWLRRLGVAVASLDAGALQHGDLKRFTTILVGIFAFGIRPDLAAARQRLRRWVEAGGHLVTLYHRPSDGWSPDETPPLHLEIGSPSLRWRVTDPAAPVTTLLPDHPLMTRPNRIGPSDWQGWDKERGLYFASGWDAAYEALVAMSDKGEAPLTGALLSAPVDRGRHTHTALVLHHQLDRLVPGAFRLLANMLQPAW
jgi:LmbE family N-acetylglucosaminyl deacetylase